MRIAQGPPFASEVDHYDEDTTHFNPSEVWELQRVINGGTVLTVLPHYLSHFTVNL